MEKKQSEVAGWNKVQIGEEGASHLVGSIIEKGISDKFHSKSFSPTPPPKPTVLPFPTARHRSHGPHWGPISSNRGSNDDIEDDEEDNDITDAYPLSAYANPVQRKNKKDLDFRRWRELIPSDELLGGRKIEEKVSSLGKSERKSKDGKKIKIANKRSISCGSPLVDKDVFDPMETDVKTDSKSCVPLDKPEEAVASSSGFELVDSVSHMELDNSNQIHHLENVKDSSSDMTPINSQLGAEIMSHGDLAEAHFEKMEKIDPTLPGVLKNKDKISSATKVFSSRPSNVGNQREAMSIESEIDVENRARLQRMSPDEIAQAQAEIMEKMDPTLLNLLKKRGQDKLKKQKSAGSVLATNAEATTILDESQSIQDAEGSPQLDVDASHSRTGQDTGVVQKKGLAGGTLWNAWSVRVEAVRELRFSLDGSVISCDFAQESESSDNSAQNMLTADNVAERDFLRTEGDPGAAGYTIKEAVALSRSTVPGQRAFALHLLASVLDKALHNFCENQVGYTLRYDKIERSIDWEAVWAYALGPEPELALLLRMSLDDNHNSVVLACLKVIQCTLSCDLNEYFFDISEKIAVFEKDIFTAPVFRSKPEIDLGFLHGGYWKYNAKPSNILPFGEEIMDDETEGKHTIQDDLAVAGQDFAAGLVRMGILPRLRYILETDPTVAMEEYIIIIFIAIARHSPTCANAIMNCERLVQTVVRRFTLNNSAEVQPAKIKSVCLLKVLARSDKKNCREFVKNGLFQAMTWHLYRPVSSLEQWVKLGRENCKFSTSLMVEQLRFWKVCIQNGYGVSYFQDVFPALCLWLNPPSFEKLIENNVLSEFVSISVEVYLVLEALAARLPKFYSQEHSECGDDNETWSWSHVGPMIDTAVKWLVLKNELCTTKFLERQNVSRSEFDFQDSSACPLLWVYSAIVLFFARVLEGVSPEDSINQHGSGKHLPSLPEFVPKIGLEIIKNGFFSFVDTHGTRYGTHFAQGISFVEELCHSRHQIEYETSLASVSCLHGLVQVIVSVDNLIQLAKPGIHYSTCQGYSLCREEKILQDGILTGCLVELRCVLKIFVELATSEWNHMQSIEIFGRGGPAPGVGHGWGASRGGFWSSTVLLVQMDARFLIHLLEIFQMIYFFELPTDEGMTFAAQSINATLGICLTAGPRDKIIVEKALEILFQAPVLKYLDLCIRHFLQVNKTLKLFGWEYKEEDYLQFSKILVSHFKNRWLGMKRKLKSTVENSSSGGKTFKKGTVSLHTIPEDIDPSNITSQDHSCSSLAVEWAHQRLPLPMHWFLSPIATIHYGKHAGLQSASKMLNFEQDPDVLEVAKGGLFFLLGIEAVATFLHTKVTSPVQSVPLFWKLHSLSVILLAGMGVLEDEKSRDVFEALQGHYGQLLDEAWASRSTELVLERDVNLLPETGKNCNVELLRFQSEIYESYSTYIETLVEQFAAVSYGDLLYGRQVGIYLHCCVEAPVRLAAWNSLSNARVLELLPPLEKCFAKAEGYLEPVEDNEEILEAYMKSWTSGALDRAATRQSMAFTLVLHHLSSFIFGLHASDKLLVRNKLAKSLLRDYSRQRQHERMMFDLIRYSKLSKSQMLEENGYSSLQQSNIDKRFEILTEACEGNSSLLIQVEKLKSYVKSTLL